MKRQRHLHVLQKRQRHLQPLVQRHRPGERRDKATRLPRLEGLIQGNRSPVQTRVQLLSFSTRTVFLLPAPSLRKETRGSQKTESQSLGCFVDTLGFSKEMSEIQVKQKLTQVFEKQLVDSEGKAVRVNFHTCLPGSHGDKRW